MNSPGNTRQTLLQKLQMQQDEHTWEEFVKYYKGYIYVCIRNLNVATDDCEDLLQDILLKIWKGLPNYSYEKDRCRFRSWLSVVVRNAVYTYYKKKHKSTNLDNHEFFLKSLDFSSDTEVDKIAEREWKIYVSNLAWKNIKKELSDRAKEVFEASLAEPDSAVLAQRFGIVESSVRVYKMRVKKALKKEIVRLNAELGG